MGETRGEIRRGYRVGEGEGEGCMREDWGEIRRRYRGREGEGEGCIEEDKGGWQKGAGNVEKK